eukprot:UN19551
MQSYGGSQRVSRKFLPTPLAVHTHRLQKGFQKFIFLSQFLAKQTHMREHIEIFMSKLPQFLT